MDEVAPERAEPILRRVAYVHGQWRVTYLSCTESGRQTDIQRGLIVGPLVSDPSTAIVWVAVMPDGSAQQIMIRRDAITSITSPPPHRLVSSQPANDRPQMRAMNPL